MASTHRTSGKPFISAVFVFCLLFVSCLHAQEIDNLNQSGQTLATAKFSPHLGSRQASEPDEVLLLVRSCGDFDITGRGDHGEWNKAGWQPLTKLDAGGKDYDTRFKILYSSTGIYVLFRGVDEKITTRDYKDFENIFNGDVVEVFFYPDPPQRVYFEYEVNQLEKELILTLSSIEGQTPTSWIPWHRSGIKKMISVVGGKKAVNGKIESWTAEIFFPYGALGLLPNMPPRSGSLWNANFCRLDYDSGDMVKWSWSPTIEKSFHELEKFRSIKFE